MTVPHTIQVDFARRKGNIPYPCGYCVNCPPMDATTETDEKNIILNFGVDGEVPVTCNAGQTKPSGYGDCKYAMFKSLEHRRMFANDIFDFLTKEYMMEVITAINYCGTVTRHHIVMRWRKGYHTREIRISELLEAGYVDMFYNIDNDETYVLTSRGRELAEAITEMLEKYIAIKEIPDTLQYDVPREVFEYVYRHSNSTKKQIYDHFGVENDYDALVPIAVDDLIADGYIEPLFNEDYSDIYYNVTQKGILRWRATYNKE